MALAAARAPPALQDLSSVAVLALLVDQCGDEDEALPFELLRDFDLAASTFLLSLFESIQPRNSGPYAAFYGNAALKALDLRSFDEAQRTDLMKDLCYGAAPHLAELCLGGQQISDRQLRLLAESCPALRELVLVECTGFTDEAFRDFGCVETLFLRQCGVKPLGRAFAEALAAVRVLDLANTPTTRSFWDTLLDQSESVLEEVHMDNLGAYLPTPKEACVRAADVAEILGSALPRFTVLRARFLELHLDDVFTAFADDNLKSIANLIELDVSYTDFDDQCMRALVRAAAQSVAADLDAPAVALKSLKARLTRIQRAGVRALTDAAALFDNLEILDLGKNVLAHGDPSSAIGERLNLGALRNLQELAMDHVQMTVDWTQTEGGLAMDLGLKARLRSLDVSFVRAFYRDLPEGAEALGVPDPFSLGMGPPAFARLLVPTELSSTLRELILSRVVMPRDELRSTIMNLPKLRTLVLDHMYDGFRDDEFDAVLGLARLRKLSIVNTMVSATTLHAYILENPAGRKLEELSCGFAPNKSSMEGTPMFSCISQPLAAKLMGLVEERRWKSHWADRVGGRDLDEFWLLRRSPSDVSSHVRKSSKRSRRHPGVFSNAGQSRELYRQAAMLRRVNARKPMMKVGVEAEKVTQDEQGERSADETRVLVRYTYDELTQLRQSAPKRSLPREARAAIVRIQDATRGAREAPAEPRSAWRSSRGTQRVESKWR